MIFRYIGLDNQEHLRSFDSRLYDIDNTSKVEYQALSSNFTRTEFSWNRLQEIKSILDHGLFRPALILALTIPDICGRIDYPNIPDDKNGTRYQKWFDENITKYNIGEVGKNNERFDCFNGYMCYLLRCRMLHGDPTNIEDVPNRPQSSLRKAGYDQVFFTFTNKEYSEFFKVLGKKKSALFCKSIPQLVMQIICCAEGCYEAEANKSKFADGCKIEWPLQFHAYSLKGGENDV